MHFLRKEHVIITFVFIYQCIINGLQYFQIKTGVAKAKYTMEAGEHHSSHARRQTETNWSAKMNMDLLICREKAKNTHVKDDCPRKPNGRKIGVMELTKMYWEELGCSNLGKTAQNLRDQSSRIEKTTITDNQTIKNEIIKQTEDAIEDNATSNAKESEQSDIVDPLFTAEEELDFCFKEIQQRVKQKYLEVKATTGDWSKRDLSTYVKKKPTSKELNNLQKILMELEMQSPIEKPHEYLWDVNCAMYAAIWG